MQVRYNELKTEKQFYDVFIRCLKTEIIKEAADIQTVALIYSPGILDEVIPFCPSPLNNDTRQGQKFQRLDSAALHYYFHTGYFQFKEEKLYNIKLNKNTQKLV